MKLNTQRRIAASLLDCGIDRVRFDPARLNDIKEGITKSDMRLLISDGLVWAHPVVGVSRVRARENRIQRRKGLQRGHGSRKGRSGAVTSSKSRWIASVRSQRAFIQELRSSALITNDSYRELYRKSKGGFFRSKRHIKLYLDDKRLWLKPTGKPQTASQTAAKAGKQVPVKGPDAKAGSGEKAVPAGEAVAKKVTEPSARRTEQIEKSAKTRKSKDLS
jgi:large subunit ribosomal protein L19e